MDNLAEYIGLVEAINHTGKRGYFKPLKGGSLRYVCYLKDFAPRENIAVCMTLMDAIVQRGGEITVHHKQMKNSAFIRYEAVMEINKRIYRAIGMSCQPAIVNCIRKYIDDLDRDSKF